jgi:ABC-2 type transport system ATP-binding protein
MRSAGTIASATAACVTAAKADALLNVRSLYKQFGDQRALCDVSFEVYTRDVIGLIGPNGAGKTTLLEVIAGLLPAEHGEVHWRGHLLPPRRRREVMFYLPDGVRPWEDLYVARVLEFFAHVYRCSASHMRDVVHAIGLAPALRKRVRALSKGFARRLMLALSLLTPHPLLLMDEPFDGLDLRQTREIMDVMRAVAANGRTLVLAIHQLADAERIADRVVLLADGQLRGTGTLAELRARTSQPMGSLEDIFLALT